MNVAAVLERLTALGVEVTPRPNGNLWLEPASVIPPALLELVRQHKPEIMALLTDQGLAPPKYHRLKYPPDQSCAADPNHDFRCWVLEEWRRVSIPEWRRILQEAEAQGDARREEYAKWMLRDVLEVDV